MGLAGYYRRFVKSFSTILTPLSRLNQHRWVFCGLYECEESYEELKTLLTSTPMLALLEEGVDFTMHYDVFRVILGGVLIQKGKVTSYASRKLKTHAKN